VIVIVTTARTVGIAGSGRMGVSLGHVSILENVRFCR
jgi:hypothetical protein